MLAQIFSEFLLARPIAKLNLLVDCSSGQMIVNHMVDDMYSGLDLVFSALADPTRRLILAQLLSADLSVKQVAQAHDMSLAAISKHLQILTRAGMVRQIKRGREKLCQLEPDSLRGVSMWIEGFGAFSQSEFDSIETAISALGLAPDHTA